MSKNELKTPEDVERLAEVAQEEAAPVKEKKKGVVKKSGRIVAQLLNGEFLSRENFIKNLPFSFYVGFLMVVIISWGYYAETVAKTEVNLQNELGELESEFATLNSEYNTRQGREHIKEKLAGSGIDESRVSPRKIRVRQYVLENE